MPFQKRPLMLGKPKDSNWKVDHDFLLDVHAFEGQTLSTTLTEAGIFVTLDRLSHASFNLLHKKDAQAPQNDQVVARLAKHSRKIHALVIHDKLHRYVPTAPAIQWEFEMVETIAQSNKQTAPLVELVTRTSDRPAVAKAFVHWSKAFQAQAKEEMNLRDWINLWNFIAVSGAIKAMFDRQFMGPSEPIHSAEDISWIEKEENFGPILDQLLGDINFEAMLFTACKE